MARASFPQLDDVNHPGFVLGTRWSGRVGVADTGDAQHSACEIHGMGCRNPRGAVRSLAGREPQSAVEYLRTIYRFADLNSPRRFGVERQRDDLSWCSLENARDLLQRFILLHTIRVSSITPASGSSDPRIRQLFARLRCQRGASASGVELRAGPGRPPPP